MAAGVSATSTTVIFQDDTHGDAGGDGSYSFDDIRNAATNQLGGAGATFAVTNGSPTIVRTGGAALTSSDQNRLLWGPGVQRDTKITAVADPNATMSLNGEATIGAAVLTASHLARIDESGPTPTYRAPKNIQNGDGSGTATTSLIAQNARIIFDSGRTYIVSTVGQTNRWTIFGTKVVGISGKPGGRNGVVLDCNAATTIRGNFLIYASMIRNSAAGGLNLQPGAADLQTEVIGCIIETTSGLGNISVGTGATQLLLIYNVEFILGGTGALTQINANEIERIWIVVTGSNFYAINTGAPFRIRDAVFVGTPLTADVRYAGGAETHFINPEWSGNAPKIEIANGYVNEWFELNTLSSNPLTGEIVGGVPIKITDDATAQVIYDGLTDSFGRIAFNNDPDGGALSVFNNAVKVIRHQGSPAVREEFGPWTIEVNHPGPNHNPAYYGYTEKFGWTYSDLPSTFGRQYEEMVIPVNMIPKESPAELGKEEWRPALA